MSKGSGHAERDPLFKKVNAFDFVRSAEGDGLHLLSVYALSGSDEFARLSCLALHETEIHCGKPFLVTRDRLEELLDTVLLQRQAVSCLDELEASGEAQFTIGLAHARALGFLAQVM